MKFSNPSFLALHFHCSSSSSKPNGHGNSEKLGIRMCTVVVFSKNKCCISYSIKTLVRDFGANPAVYELDELPRGQEIEQALSRLRCNPTIPAVFIRGELVSGANDVVSLHLNRSLIPMLKEARDLWV